MFDVNNLAKIRVSLASPEAIRKWSHGEVTKPETINYRSQKPEPDGLFCEKIFGPAKNYTCHCGRYSRPRYAGLKCEKCGVEVISKDVRRERMGHIALATPCTHIWYLKGIPSRISLVLDIPAKQLEEITYFVSHVVVEPGQSVNLEKRQFIDEQIAREVFPKCIDEILANHPEWTEETTEYQYAISYKESMANPNEAFLFDVYSRFIEKHLGAKFGEGAETIKTLLQEFSANDNALLKETIATLENRLKTSTGPQRAKDIKRLECLEAFRTSGNKPEWMVLDVIPVIPPDLRPMLQLDGGRFASSDLIDLYRRVISRNIRLTKLINMNAPYVILMNEKRMLQEAVDALIDNGRRNKPITGPSGRPYKSLSNVLRGKQGRFRQNLLGKRVDFSGRSVIAVGPDLKMYQCGLPREMAIQLLRPYIAHELLTRKLVGSHKAANNKIDQLDPIVFDIVEEIIGNHPVLLNRAPTLHRLGIQAFQPKLVDGRAIRLHPLVCAGFNADFDGDQMAVHLPISKAAQEEALNLMLASNNILGPKDGKPVVTPSQDMVLGNYYLTKVETKDELLARAQRRLEKGDYEEYELFSAYGNAEGKVFHNINEVLTAYDTKQVHLHTRVAIRGSALQKSCFTKEMNESYLLTTVGKIIFNLIFPEDFPFLNEPTLDNYQDKIGPNGQPYSFKFFVPRGTNIKEYYAEHNDPELLTKPFAKKNLGAIIDEVYARYGTSKTSVVLDKMKDQGFAYSTKAGFTIAFSDIPVLENKESFIDVGDELVANCERLYEDGLFTKEEHHNAVLKIWSNTKEEVKNSLEKQFSKDTRNPIYMMTNSGARGNIGNLLQLSGMIGLESTARGETIEIPVKSNYRSGLSVSEYFIATHGGRKGVTDTALKTAESGYLTRRLVDVSQDVIVREDDCHTDQGYVVKEIRDVKRNSTITSLESRITGRYPLHNIYHPTTGELIVDKDTLIDEDIAKVIKDSGIKEVTIRSIFGCRTKKGVCVHCYGRNLATGQLVNKGEAVGIMAAQSIGEPGTQLTLRTFHSGGVASDDDITSGLPRVVELVEARCPKAPAVISKTKGVVTKIIEEASRSGKELGSRFIITVENTLESGEKEIQNYTTAFNAHLAVKEGDQVQNGQPLTLGAINPQELIQYADIATVQEYIMSEIHKVYSTASVGIQDKHIEIIISQMLRKVTIDDAGDTDFVVGSKVDVVEFTEKNADVLFEGKRPARAHQEILGITKAALATKSFLSAASFQETTRVLTDAAVRGKVDELHGLKENVITGKLIPAGTGLRTKEEEEAILNSFSVESKMEEIEKRYVGIHDRPIDIE